MVGQTKKKLKVCLLCNSVFANAAHLKRHEANSELHKKNIEAEKIAKELALLSWIIIINEQRQDQERRRRWTDVKIVDNDRALYEYTAQ